MSPLSRVQLQMIFNKLDRNGDGLVSVDELASLLNGLGIDSSRDELELLVGGKALDYIEFLFFCQTLTKGSSEEEELLERDLRRAFRVFDLNGDGYITCEELRIALSRLAVWDDERGQDCRQMIAAHDRNSDGVLDFEEFKQMVMLAGQ